MAYRPDDPYNTGINTIGTDLGLGNINQGQNMQTAGVWGNIMPEFMGGYSKEEMARNAALEQIEGLRINQMKGIPTAKDPVGQKEIIDNLQYTNPDKLKQYQDYEKQIEELKKQYPGDVNIQGAYLNDDKTPYDFSGIKGQTADLSGTFGVFSENADISRSIDNQVIDYENEYMERTGKVPPPFYGEKKRMELQIKFLEMQERKKEATTATTAAAKADAAAQAQAQASQRQADQARISRAYREETGGQAGSYAPGGGSGAHAADASGSTYSDPFDPGGGEAQGGFIDGTNRRRNYLDGGLIDFFRYGGFIG